MQELPHLRPHIARPLLAKAGASCILENTVWGGEDAVDQPEDRRQGIQTCRLDRTKLSTFVSEVLNEEEVRLASTVVILTDSRANTGRRAILR